MFLGHIAFSTTVVTAVLGFVLLAWSKKEVAAASLLKKAGLFILVLSLLNMGCISYYLFQYTRAGFKPFGMSCHHGESGGSCPMHEMMQK